MKHCVAFGKILKKLIIGEINLTMMEILTGIGLLISIISIITWSFYAIVSKERKTLLEKVTMSSIGKLYFGIDMKSKFGLFYF